MLELLLNDFEYRFDGCDYYVDISYYQELLNTLSKRDDIIIEAFTDRIEVMDTDETTCIVIYFEEMETTEQIKRDIEYWKELAIISKYW